MMKGAIGRGFLVAVCIVLFGGILAVGVWSEYYKATHPAQIQALSEQNR